MITSFLREDWVFCAKNVHSLLEWIWPSLSLVASAPVLFSSSFCFYRFKLFFPRSFCAQEIIRKEYKHVIIMLDELDLFRYFGPNDPSLQMSQGMNCLLMFVKCHWYLDCENDLMFQNYLSWTHTVADSQIDFWQSNSKLCAKTVLCHLLWSLPLFTGSAVCSQKATHTRSHQLHNFLCNRKI